MTPYLELLREVVTLGCQRKDRTGVGTRSIFGKQITIPLDKGFPLLTTKKLHFKSIAYELLWFLSGNTNIQWLNDNGVTIWDEWADESGDLGAIYGTQWRSWKAPDGRCIDQISNVIRMIQQEPYSRRLIVTAWNPADIHNMALPPCHCMFQFYVYADQLSCHLYQRSADVFLGLPFNIASYALLTHMIASVTDLNASRLVISLGDAHVYLNHTEQATEQLGREPKKLPKLILNPRIRDIFDFKYADIFLDGYHSHPHIAAEVAV